MSLPLYWYESRLFEHLAELLPAYLAAPQVQEILANLRSALLAHETTANLQYLHTTVKHCRKCADAVVSSPHLPSWNVVNPDVVFVSAVTITDDQEAGYLINHLRGAGFASSQVALTSLMRCIPKEGRPQSSEIAACLPYLTAELQIWQPKLIATLGGAPTSALLGDVKITKSRGILHWIGPWAVFPMLDPRYAIRSEQTDIFTQDLQQAHKFVYGADEVPT
ncbi:MAG TPA: uracil-DNA glycosylase family protein [Nitrososphaera sp.]|nr:uracil-DNA glycosylase family protein [Nitrososphaera sp.]